MSRREMSWQAGEIVCSDHRKGIPTPDSGNSAVHCRIDKTRIAIARTWRPQPTHWGPFAQCSSKSKGSGSSHALAAGTAEVDIERGPVLVDLVHLVVAGKGLDIRTASAFLSRCRCLVFLHLAGSSFSFRT